MKTTGQESRTVSFGCGALFGIFVGIGFGLDYVSSTPTFLAMIVAGSLICGILAAVLGDSFWHKFSSWFPFG
ncbi:MAG: hypothetical protein K0U98_08745 [Deltaproteobacteria bacterium]|nr:hypothetical protein [Deltaproteobacteria bacterium]